MNVTLSDVKNAIGITGDYLDPTLQVYFDDVVDAIIQAGVSPSNITAGLVARGVTDLWNYGAGGGKLSEYFYQRIGQLRYKN